MVLDIIIIYTNWDKDSMLQGFEEKNSLFYILTNSRGFTAEQTTKVHHEIASVIDEYQRETGKEYIFISRSDSTLRGHYPLETEILKEDYEKNTGKIIDGEIICPFLRGQPFTIDNARYVKYGNELIPANETRIFERLRLVMAWEQCLNMWKKDKGKYKASDVCIPLEDMRSMNIDKIEQTLSEVNGFNKIIVNAVDYADIKVFCVALYRAMQKEKSYVPHGCSDCESNGNDQ